MKDFDLQHDALNIRNFSSIFRPRDKILTVGYISVIAMFSIIYLWSTLVPLAESLVVSGTVSVTTQRRTVSHVEGGAVSELKVKEGDHVEVGETLLLLDDRHLKADLAILEHEHFILMATLNRWKSEQLGETTITFAPALTKEGQSAIDRAKILQSEEGAFEARRIGFASQREAFDDRIQRAKDAIQRSSQKLESLDRQQHIVEQQTNDALDLLAKGYGTKSRVVELRLEREQIHSRKLEIEAEIDGLRGTVHDARLGKKNLLAEHSLEIETNLAEAQSQLAELDLQIYALRERIDNLNIRSTVRGIIVDLKVRANNEVVKAAAPILDILPVDSAYSVEVQVSPDQIEGVIKGMEVYVRFPSLSGEQPPEILGAVTMVSADTVYDPKTQSRYYQANIALSEHYDRMMLTRIIPGMPTEVTFEKEGRTAFEYFLAPLMRHLTSSAV